mmetsp:Transcript_1835/g.2108  ORF Transcript_1835/g.2108 Transcript_1835/m.2108 type:complete len:132 (-) Transcript_1835:361-756(-)
MAKLLTFFLAAFAALQSIAAIEFLTLEPTAEFLALSHYGNPEMGCQSDEVAIRIQGVQGGVCAPACDGFSCPSDVPSGCTATPQCALQDGSSGKKYCALTCNKESNCGAGASCKMIGFVGICTYDLSVPMQ